MTKAAKLLNTIVSNPKNVAFNDLAKLCEQYFGTPRNKGTSHYVYKTPWPGDPRVNIQKGKEGKAKPYQVRQVLAAIRKLENMDDD